jgi:hypothetical protein
MTAPSFQPVDQNGFLLNTTSERHLAVSPWRDVLASSVDAIAAHFTGALHSIYVRGSVPTGAAVLGYSDIDLIAVLQQKIEAEHREWRRAFERASRSTPVEIELGLVAVRRLTESDESWPWSFILGTQSLCVRGENIIPSLPRFRPDHYLARKLAAGTQRFVDRAILRAHNDSNPNAVKNLCRQAAKYLLRSLAALFIEGEGYTRDLRTIAALTTAKYPAQRQNVRQALALALEPTKDSAVVLRFLDSFGKWAAERVAHFERLSAPNEEAVLGQFSDNRRRHGNKSE